ncbi:SRPBCC family protein [Cryptosporangium sp. NPDC048952]|uniref:SRPBCC family protein n=1 Tax=Cryptosporangium sp. NPDC048952 TaxID=3363961 RepID=UPI00371F9F37
MPNENEQIDAVTRGLAHREVDGSTAKVATISQVYDTGIDDLWEAVSSAERIPRWFLPVSGELKEGGHYQLEGNASGTITACDKPRSYAATWEYGGMVSWITVRLTSLGDSRTQFELEHVAHVDDNLWEQFGPGATGLGWEMGLWGLVSYLADPASTPADPAAAAAWAASSQGKAYLKRSSEAWAEAAIASGDDPDEARAAAERTYEAYTAEG